MCDGKSDLAVRSVGDERVERTFRESLRKRVCEAAGTVQVVWRAEREIFLVIKKAKGEVFFSIAPDTTRNRDTIEGRRKIDASVYENGAELDGTLQFVAYYMLDQQ